MVSMMRSMAVLSLGIVTAAMEGLPAFLVEAEEKKKKVDGRLKLAAPVLDLTPENYELETMDHTKIPIVTGFFTGGCKFCRRTRPVIENLAKTLEGSVRFGGVDAGVFDKLKQEKGAGLVPTFFMYKTSGAVTRYFGPRTEDDLYAWVSWHSGHWLDESHLVWWKKIAYILLHATISVLVAVLNIFGFEATDHGSGGGPFPDGGTIGFCGLMVGIAFVVFSFILGVATAGSPPPPPIKKKEAVKKQE